MGKSIPPFPSLEWFCALRDLVNREEGYHRLGTCDAQVGFGIGDRSFLVHFDAFAVGDVRELAPEAAAADADFVLEMSAAEWKELVDNIRKHEGADAEHTLNTLVFVDRLKLRYRDSIGMDKFYQYNQSLQYFLDAVPRLEGASAPR